LKLKVASFDFKGSTSINVGTDYFFDETIFVKSTQLQLTNVDEQVVSIATLRSSAINLYAIKRRSATKLYNDVDSIQPSYHNDKTLMNLASYIGAFNDAFIEEDVPTKASVDSKTISTIVKHKRINVLILNEGQHAALVKKGVKLSSIGSLVKSKLDALDGVEKFTDVTRRLITLSKVRHLKGMYEGLGQCSKLSLTDVWKDSTSLFKSLFNEYRALRQKNPQYADAFAKLDLLMMIGKLSYTDHETEASRLQLQIDAQYPMLSLVGYGQMYDRGEKAKKIIAYIDQIEQLINQAVIEAAKEVSVEEALTVEEEEEEV